MERQFSLTGRPTAARLKALVLEDGYKLYAMERWWLGSTGGEEQNLVCLDLGQLYSLFLAL